jgi:AcrR family transcriptional regulator
MNEDILEAAARVLVRDGAAAFTTNRVAEVAGISVGSLYQYYPNKQALLFRLQEREMETTWRALDALLSDRSRPPRRRVEQVVAAFFVSEVEEASLRSGLLRAEVWYEESPEYRALEARIEESLRGFLREVLPARTPALDLRARVLLAVVTGVGERLARGDVPVSEARRWARACSDMLCGWLGLRPAARALVAAERGRTS